MSETREKERLTESSSTSPDIGLPSSFTVSPNPSVIDRYTERVGGNESVLDPRRQLCGQIEPLRAKCMII